MIFALLVLLGLIGALVGGVRLNLAVERARERYRVLCGGYTDARLTVEARERFRRRQQRVERAVDTGTVGAQAAHRALSGWFGGEREGGRRVYDGLRSFNRGLGRALNRVFAPGPRRRKKKIEEPSAQIERRGDTGDH